MFSVQTSVVRMPVISVEAAASPSLFHLALLVIHSKKGKKKKKRGVRIFFLEKGSFHGNLLLADLRVDEASFTNFLWMSMTDFKILCTVPWNLSEALPNLHTDRRESIPGSS